MKTCENCSSLIDGNYGSGRFCSQMCARSFSTKNKRHEINQKVSEQLRGRGNGDVNKVCEHCDNQFIVEYNKRHHTFCSRECSAEAKRLTPEGIHPVVGYRQRIKARAIKYKGGRCVECGYDRCTRALQFHHLDPTKKDFGIGGKSLSWDKIKTELDKCILVCGNCHAEIHDGLIDVTKYKLGV